MYQEVEDKENKRAGIIAAMIFLICLFLFFFMVSLRVPDPPKKPEPPLELEILSSGGSSGGSSAAGAEQTTEEQVEDQVESNPSDAIETQPEESTPIESSEEDTDQETDDTEERRPDPNALFPGMSGDSGDGGEGQGEGDNDGNDSGNGNGNGNGPGSGDFDLAGRSLKNRPSSDINTSEEGIIVLNIWVAPDGSVERATYNRAKSTIQDQSLIDYCVRQANNELEFNAKPGAPIEQKGTYTFRFVTH